MVFQGRSVSLREAMLGFSHRMNPYFTNLTVANAASNFFKSKTRWRFGDEVVHQLGTPIYIIYRYIIMKPQFCQKHKNTKFCQQKNPQCAFTTNINLALRYYKVWFFSPIDKLKKTTMKQGSRYPPHPG